MKIILTLLLLSSNFLFAQKKYPAAVEDVLKQTKNRTELEKVLNYFIKTKDSLKIKSANFLISNMAIHYTANYYWADKSGKRIPYNEADYATFNEAVGAVNKIKATHLGLHPVPYSFKDIDSIKSNFLIENIEQAVGKYKANKYNISLSDFFEYVLPYRISNEPLQAWRKTYSTKFASSFTPTLSAKDNIAQLRQSINKDFTYLWDSKEQFEPLPRLGAMQILIRGKGKCEDVADKATFLARSQGIPSTVDNIPAWATSTGCHFLNMLFIDSANKHFDAVLDSLGREPGKVLRTTYSIQSDAIANLIDTSLIPNNFLRLKNYKDVTNEYWKTEDITCKIFPNTQAKVVYACVHNGGIWQPIWFGLPNGNTVTFKNMSKGVVYTPFYYINNLLVPAGYPFALGYNNKTELNPNEQELNTIVLPEQDRYLKYREGKRYRLLIWNNQWQLFGEQVAPKDATSLTFNKVPSNSLLLMIPEYSQGKERPFMILENGERVWW